MLSEVKSFEQILLDKSNSWLDALVSMELEIGHLFYIWTDM